MLIVKTPMEASIALADMAMVEMESLVVSIDSTKFSRDIFFTEMNSTDQGFLMATPIHY